MASKALLNLCFGSGPCCTTGCQATKVSLASKTAQLNTIALVNDKDGGVTKQSARTMLPG